MITDGSATGRQWSTLMYLTTYNIGIYTGGKDYNSEPIFIKFDTETTRVSFNVPVLEDKVLEGNETFNLIIDPSSLTNNKITVGDPDQATVTIVDNDGKQRIMVLILYRA